VLFSIEFCTDSSLRARFLYSEDVDEILRFIITVTALRKMSDIEDITPNAGNENTSIPPPQTSQQNLEFSAATVLDVFNLKLEALDNQRKLIVVELENKISDDFSNRKEQSSFTKEGTKLHY